MRLFSTVSLCALVLGSAVILRDNPAIGQEFGLPQEPVVESNSDPQVDGEQATIAPRRARTVNHDFTRTVDGDTVTIERHFSGPIGQTQDFERTRTRDGESSGTLHREKTVTLRDGRTVNHEFTRTVDGDTLSVERNFTGPNGQTRSFERTWTGGGDSTAGTLQRNQTVTLRDGRTVNHEFTRTVDGDTITVERQFTGPNGQTHASTANGTITDAQPEARKESFWGKLNPFRRSASASPRTAEPPARRGGFTLGRSRTVGGQSGTGGHSHRNWTPGSQAAVARQANAQRANTIRQQRLAHGRGRPPR